VSLFFFKKKESQIDVDLLNDISDPALTLILLFVYKPNIWKIQPPIHKILFKEAATPTKPN
jgi:hypothetical protein